MKANVYCGNLLWQSSLTLQAADIYYYKDQSYDLDFCLVRHGKIVELIQVSYTIEGEKTRKRELQPLFGAGRKLGCAKLTLVTDHERETVASGDLTVEVVTATDWLCQGGE